MQLLGKIQPHFRRDPKKTCETLISADIKTCVGVIELFYISNGPDTVASHCITVC